MTEGVTSEDERADWPLRPWLLAGLLGLAGLLIHFITHENEDVAWRVALAAFVLFGALAAAFTLEQERWKAPSLFALAIGAVMAGLAWRAVQYGESLPDEQYGFAAGVVASALALPLFQADFHRRRLATPYSEIYGHVWTDAISAAGALAFTGLSWVVLAFLSELFRLLKIDFLHELMDHAWFGWTFSGLAAGAALGTLRNQLKVLATMRTVVLLVLSLLAVPLAVGLTVFLGATAVSGPQVLWDATRSATPLLLACAAGAWVLASVIARDADAAMSRSRVMHLAAIVLAAVVLPLAVFAAVSMGLRLNQYGLAPERLWGLVAIVVALVFGVALWVALVRGRKGGWAAKLRQTNFHLGLFVCALALLLALPVLDFGAISTRNQIARLESGKVEPEDFDFDALRWDFGEPGQRALQRLAKAGGEVAEGAREALARRERVWPSLREDRTEREERVARLRFETDDAALRAGVEKWLEAEPWRCNVPCTALDLGVDGERRRHVALVETGEVEHLAVQEGGSVARLQPREFARPAAPSSSPTPKVEVRPWTGRQIYVDGKPVGEPFE